MTEICVSHCAIELEGIWFLWIGRNLYCVQNETLSQVFSYKFVNFCTTTAFGWRLANYSRIFGLLLLDFLLLNWIFVNVIKIMDLTILKVYPVKLTRISFLIKSRFIWLLHCTKSIRICLYSVWMWENADQNSPEYGHFLCSVVL